MIGRTFVRAYGCDILPQKPYLEKAGIGILRACRPIHDIRAPCRADSLRYFGLRHFQAEIIDAVVVVVGGVHGPGFGEHVVVVEALDGLGLGLGSRQGRKQQHRHHAGRDDDGEQSNERESIAGPGLRSDLRLGTIVKGIGLHRHCHSILLAGLDLTPFRAACQTRNM